MIDASPVLLRDCLVGGADPARLREEKRAEGQEEEAAMVKFDRLFGKPIQGRPELFIVWCPKCSKEIRIGTDNPHPPGPSRLLDRCPHCQTYIDPALIYTF